MRETLLSQNQEAWRVMTRHIVPAPASSVKFFRCIALATNRTRDNEPAFRKTLRSARAPENSHGRMNLGDKGMNLARKGIELDRKGMNLDAERKEFKSAFSRGNARRRPPKANRRIDPCGNAPSKNCGINCVISCGIKREKLGVKRDAPAAKHQKPIAKSQPLTAANRAPLLSAGFRQSIQNKFTIS